MQSNRNYYENRLKNRNSKDTDKAKIGNPAINGTYN